MGRIISGVLTAALAAGGCGSGLPAGAGDGGRVACVAAPKVSQEALDALCAALSRQAGAQGGDLRLVLLAAGPSGLRARLDRLGPPLQEGAEIALNVMDRDVTAQDYDHFSASLLNHSLTIK